MAQQGAAPAAVGNFAFSQAWISSVVFEDIPADHNVPSFAQIGHWSGATYGRIDKAFGMSKHVFRLQQEYLKRLIQVQSDDNLKDRLDTMRALQGTAKDMAELTSLKFRLRLWELYMQQNLTPA